TPLADASVISNITPLSSLAPNVDGVASIPDPDYEISDLNIVGNGVQNDNCRTVEGMNTVFFDFFEVYGISNLKGTEWCSDLLCNTNNK
ncbi:hypothetical protein Tco_0384712, partial [Tanacetum coccineum]